MIENLNISRKKRKLISIEIPNKDITCYDNKIFPKYKINNSNIFKNSNFKTNSEDDYDYNVYNEQICNDKIFFGNNFYEKKHSLIKTTSGIFNNKKNFLFKSNSIPDYFEKNIKNNIMLNLSFETKNQNIIFDYEKTLTKNNSESYKNLKKIINLFSFITKKRHNKIKKTKDETKISNLYTDNLKINYIKFSSKFSRKNKNKTIITENIHNNYPLHKRNTTELYIDLEKSIPKNKIIKFDKHNNISKVIPKKNKNNTNPSKINFKIYDDNLMNAGNNKEVLEKENKLNIKGSNLNRSMRRININLNDRGIDKNIYLNNSKIKNRSINYSNPKKKQSNERIKTIINNYLNKEKFENSNILYKAKKKEDLRNHKIIKKRVILEEEYIVNSEGDQKLLSIRRLEDDNNNEDSNISQSIKNNHIKEQTVNNENPMNKKYKLNNSFFSPIFNESLRKTTSSNRLGIKSIDDVNQISHIFNNHKITKNNQTKSKNIITNPSLIKKRNNKIKKEENKLYIQTDLNRDQSKENKIKKESNNKERSLNKKLFYNRIYINKFNKSNNNSKMNFQPNHKNSNKTSINIDDKDISKREKNKGIYKKISFFKKQPFMIYHNEENSQNFYINNNQNCSNLVNIVFLNNEKNKNYKGIERHKAVCGLKRNNYKFLDTKTISTENNNTSGIKSTRNHYNKNIMNESSYDDSPLEIKKNNHNIYSSMDNFNDNKTKNLKILDYISSKPKLGIDEDKSKYIQKPLFNRSGVLKYHTNYIE